MNIFYHAKLIPVEGRRNMPGKVFIHSTSGKVKEGGREVISAAAFTAKSVHVLGN